jgi:hypothetical protein
MALLPELWLLELPRARRTRATRARLALRGPAVDARLREVEVLRERIEELDRQLHVAAVSAREEGATWQQLGAALGITAKSAWKRYVA